MKYVLGFVFNESLDKIALIRKNRPAWQKGLLNGIGGKIEADELTLDAMTREFEEETSCSIDNYKWFDFVDYCKVPRVFGLENGFRGLV